MKSQVFLSIVLTLAVGCATARYTKLEGGAKVPAASGELASRPTDNGNLKIDLSVQHLAEPSRVSAGAKTYVVWAEPNRGSSSVRNLGALKINDDLRGELNTMTPYADFHLFLTAENSPQAERPTGEPLLWADVSNK